MYVCGTLDSQVPALLGMENNCVVKKHNHEVGNRKQKVAVEVNKDLSGQDSGFGTPSQSDSNDDLMTPKFPNLPVPIGLQLSWLDKHISHLLLDPRDTVMVKTSLFLTVALCSGLWLTCVNFSWPLFAAHAVFLLNYSATFVLMLHCVSHRPLYRPEYNVLNWFIPYALGPVFGHTFNTFYYHHVKHHHIEDNGPNDLSCTLRYQRDSFFGFLHYFGRFLFCGIFELALHFYNKKWYRAMAGVLIGEFGTFTLYFFLIVFGKHVSGNEHPYHAAGLVLFLPFFLMRFGMMSGNWAQHAFVDRKRLDCDYVQSLTCIDVAYNRFAFNDGYHTSHHLNPRRHWADHPAHFVKNHEELAKEGTLVFRGIDFHMCWFFLMTKNYNALSKAFVHLDANTPKPSSAEIIRMLKLRVSRVPDKVIEQYYGEKAARRGNNIAMTVPSLSSS